MDLLWLHLELGYAIMGLVMAIDKSTLTIRYLLYQVRPPGHHALDSTVMGFCLHNNAAVAAKAALAAGAKKIMILDWVSMKTK